jgi:fucose permease
MVLGCFVAFASLLLLSFTTPPVGEHWRLPGLLGLGLGGGLLNTAIFQALSPAYRINPAATVNLAGIFLGLGAFLSPLLIAGTFNLYSVSTILYIVALVPAFFAISYARVTFPPGVVEPSRPMREILREFTVPAAVLLSLLLFFHFGNEWAIAGWLPLFLILRLGLSPVTALMLLLLYWFALIMGRTAVQALLSRFSHTKLLLGSILASLLGCLFLGFTNNLFGATVGTLLVGGGFAPIYPLVVGAIRTRFPHYHPGFFNGIFSIGLTGGMLAPATLGYAADSIGLRAVTLLPVLGTLIVLVLVLVIWLEAWFTRWHTSKAELEGPR